MNPNKQIAQLFKSFYYGDNWTGVNFKDELADVSWQEATTPVNSLNTIAALVFHINFYIDLQLKFLQGAPLSGGDHYSFGVSPIGNERDWKRLLDKTWADAEKFQTLVEQLPEERLLEIFGSEQHGNYYRNLHGVIEHGYYHLGQIVLIKKLLRTENLAKS